MSTPYGLDYTAVRNSAAVSSGARNAKSHQGGAIRMFSDSVGVRYQVGAQPVPGAFNVNLHERPLDFLWGVSLPLIGSARHRPRRRQLAAARQCCLGRRSYLLAVD